MRALLLTLAFGTSIAGAASVPVASFTRPQALAYWLDAYNAHVLETIVAHYPIRGRTLVGVAFPPGSIWQISGAFKARRHFAALGGGDERRGVRECAARHVADPAIAATLRAADTRLKYLDYDWRLNE